jgi:hypothetical protein
MNIEIGDHQEFVVDKMLVILFGVHVVSLKILAI